MIHIRFRYKDRPEATGAHVVFREKNLKKQSKFVNLHKKSIHLHFDENGKPVKSKLLSKVKGFLDSAKETLNDDTESPEHKEQFAGEQMESVSACGKACDSEIMNGDSSEKLESKVEHIVDSSDAVNDGEIENGGSDQTDLDNKNKDKKDKSEHVENAEDATVNCIDSNLVSKQNDKATVLESHVEMYEHYEEDADDNENESHDRELVSYDDVDMFDSTPSSASKVNKVQYYSNKIRFIM